MSDLKPYDNAPPPGPDALPGPDTPPGPVTPEAPDMTKGSLEYRLVCFEGTVHLFTAQMPESSFVDFSVTGTHHVFACCWIDGKRGASSFVTFPSRGGPGEFSFDLLFRDNDPDLVKVQFLMRMQDPGTGIRRTVHLCCGCADMQAMLSRQETDNFKLVNQFMEGDYARVSMRVANAHEFGDRALLLRPSALKNLPAFNAGVESVGKSIAGNVKNNHTEFSRGSQDMADGKSRSLPRLLLFVALLLGTPAYVFMLPSVQPRVRGAHQRERRG